MTITKQIIPTKADVSVADLSKFLVIHPKEFVFNPRTHGKHIGFGYNNTDVNKRKKINEQLKAQIKDICPILIRGSLEDGGETNDETA